MKKRIVSLLIAVLAIGLVPAVAGAQEVEVEVEPEIEIGDDATIEDAEAAIEEFLADVAEFKEAYPDLDYTDLDAAIADLEAALEGGDLDEIAAAAAAAQAAADALVAQVPAPTVVNTGSGVDGGPNVAVLVLAAVFALVALGTVGARVRFDRR